MMVYRGKFSFIIIFLSLYILYFLIFQEKYFEGYEIIFGHDHPKYSCNKNYSFVQIESFKYSDHNLREFYGFYGTSLK